MTVSSVQMKTTYSGDGSTTVFNTQFPFLASTDIEVYSISNTGVLTQKTLTTDFSVAGGNDAIGTVTMNVAPASGTSLFIRRVTAKTQPIHYTAFDPFPAATNELALDRATMIMQDLNDVAYRALLAPKQETTIGELPPLAMRKGMFLGFDGTTGDPVALAGTTTSIVTGGAIDGTAIGQVTPANGSFTFLAATGLSVGNAGANYLAGAGSATGNPVTVGATGIDANIPILLLPKGASTVQAKRLALGLSQVFDGSTIFSLVGNPSYSTVCNPNFTINIVAQGAITSGGGGLNSININTDVVDPTTGSGPQGVNGLYIGHNFGGTGAKGGRTAVQILLNQVGVSVSRAQDFYSAFGSFFYANYSAGGTVGTPQGNAFAGNTVVDLQSGCGLYWSVATSFEFDISVRSGAQVQHKGGVSVVQLTTDATSGVLSDFAIGMANQTGGTAPGWNVGLTFGFPTGWWPIKSTGTLIGTYPAIVGGGPSMAAAYGVKLDAVTFSVAAFKSTGFSVDPVGNVLAKNVVPTGYITPSTTLGLVAAGATQGTATPIPSEVNEFATVAAGTGGILQYAPGALITVVNDGANTLNVYPFVTAQINALAVNVAITVAAGANMKFRILSTTKIITV